MIEWEKIRGRLNAVRAWHDEGREDAYIAERLRVSQKELNALAEEHPSLADALGRGQLVVDRVEEALLQIATGGELRDRTFELREDGEGQKSMVLVKEVVKQKEPDLAAVKMWLKSRAGDRWQDDVPASTEHGVDPGELVREAKRLIQEVESEKLKVES